MPSTTADTGYDKEHTFGKIWIHVLGVQVRLALNGVENRQRQGIDPNKAHRSTEFQRLASPEYMSTRVSAGNGGLRSKGWPRTPSVGVRGGSESGR